MTRMYIYIYVCVNKDTMCILLESVLKGKIDCCGEGVDRCEKMDR
jgi:hypothetical protein